MRQKVGSNWDPAEARSVRRDSFTPEHDIHKRVYKMPAYTSTSLSRDFAKDWAGPPDKSKHIYRDKKMIHKNSKFFGRQYAHIMHIHIPEGSHAFYTHHEPYKPTPGSPDNPFGSDTKTTLHPSEQEVILHKGMKLHIHPTPTVDHETHSVMWHAKMIHDGVKPTKFGDLV